MNAKIPSTKTIRTILLTTERVVEIPTAAAPVPVCIPRKQPTPAMTIPNMTDLTIPE